MALPNGGLGQDVSLDPVVTVARRDHAIRLCPRCHHMVWPRVKQTVQGRRPRLVGGVDVPLDPFEIIVRRIAHEVRFPLVRRVEIVGRRGSVLFRRKFPLLVGPAIASILSDIAPVCHRSTHNIQTLTTVDGPDLETLRRAQSPTFGCPRHGHAIDGPGHSLPY